MDWFNRPDVTTVAEKAPLQVSELSAIIEGLLDNPLLQDILVRGEVTNYTHHARGHRYFSLSEKGGGNTAAVIKCVMWRSDAERLSFIPSEGMEVIVSGTVRVYAPHGSYQLQVKEMRKAGLGEKFLLVEQWKKELAAEGCFSLERKRCLPRFPARIGVVTSETGAVIHDIRTVVDGVTRWRSSSPRLQYRASGHTGRLPLRSAASRVWWMSSLLPGAGAVLRICSPLTIRMLCGPLLHARFRSSALSVMKWM